MQDLATCIAFKSAESLSDYFGTIHTYLRNFYSASGFTQPNRHSSPSSQDGSLLAKAHISEPKSWRSIELGVIQS